MATWRGICRGEHTGSKAEFAHRLAAEPREERRRMNSPLHLMFQTISSAELCTFVTAFSSHFLQRRLRQWVLSTNEITVTLSEDRA